MGRFLRDEPIHARPVTPAEKLWRWCRRHRGLAATGAVSLSLLLCVAIGSPIAALRIHQERNAAVAARKNEEIHRRHAEAEQKKAETEAIKSKQVATFMQEMFRGLNPDAAKGRDISVLKEVIGRMAQRMTKELAGQPGVEIELRNTLAEAYNRMASCQEAERMARESLRLCRLHLGDHPTTAHALNQLAHARSCRKDYAEAESYARESLELRRKLPGTQPVQLAQSLRQVGEILLEQGRPQEAAHLFREAFEVNWTDAADAAASLKASALVLGSRGSFDEAATVLREALLSWEEAGKEDDTLKAAILHELALVPVRPPKFGQPELLPREAPEIRKKFYLSGMGPRPSF